LGFGATGVARLLGIASSRDDRTLLSLKPIGA
jgi:hypothetical protein